jgi:hypothetical protein
LIAVKSIAANKGRIVSQENSGTVGVGLGEFEGVETFFEISTCCLSG